MGQVYIHFLPFSCFCLSNWFIFLRFFCFFLFLTHGFVSRAVWSIPKWLEVAFLIYQALLFCWGLYIVVYSVCILLQWPLVKEVLGKWPNSLHCLIQFYLMLRWNCILCHLLPRWNYNCFLPNLAKRFHYRIDV